MSEISSRCNQDSSPHESIVVLEHAFTHTYTHTHTHTCFHTNNTCMHKCALTRTHISAHTHTYICTHTTHAAAPTPPRYPQHGQAKGRPN